MASALKLLDERLCRAVSSVKDKSFITEIHLRRGGCLSVSKDSRELFVTADGELKDECRSAVPVFDEDIEYTYRTAMKNSLHAYENEIRQGYVTAEGGNRVGFCGRAICADPSGESVQTLREIMSVNIRISHELIGCADMVFNAVFADGLCSLIIAGPPSSGKTTVLRDLCRRLSASCRISLIDERGELAAVSDGRASNDVGSRTDIFTGYPKLSAITTAVRVMSPQVLICDEIGAEGELPAFEYAINSGVKLVASCHASDYEELLRRPVVSELIRKKAFDRAVFLGSGSDIGRMLFSRSFGEIKC